MSLMPLIRQLQASVSNIRCINAGGCAVFAALVGQQLNKRGIPFKIRVADDENITKLDAIPSAREKNCVRASEWDSNGVGFGHVFLEVQEAGKSIFFDSESVTEAKSYFNLPRYGPLAVYKDDLTLKETVLIAKDKGYWARSFNRKNIPKMIKEISRAFKKELDADALLN